MKFGVRKMFQDLQKKTWYAMNTYLPIYLSTFMLTISFVIWFIVNFIMGFIALTIIVKLFSNDVTMKEIFITTVLIEVAGIILGVSLGIIGMVITGGIMMFALIFFCRFEGGSAFSASILYSIFKLILKITLLSVVG